MNGRVDVYNVYGDDGMNVVETEQQNKEDK